MKKFYLIDYDHNKIAKKQDKLYMVAANIAVKYGNFGRRFKNCDETYIQEFWDGDDCPSFEYFLKHIQVSVVKWYIHNRLNLSDRIWSGDFLHGLSTAGRINWNKSRFPTLKWVSNDLMFRLFSSCGFGGKPKRYKTFTHKDEYTWNGVPALYLKYDESSVSFMAGLFASGLFEEKDGQTYVKYNRYNKPYLEKWAIPIEKASKDGSRLLISPIWGSLFVSRMPEEIREQWLNLKNPFGRDIYPPILWKTYANNNFPRWGIPYLKSRRWIYNHYKSEQGAMKTLEKERVARNLTQLDKRVRSMVHEWRKNV